MGLNRDLGSLNVLNEKYIRVKGVKVRYTVNGESLPVLVIRGAQDRVMSLKCARNTNSLISGCRLEVIDKSGYCPHIEKAYGFNDLVIRSNTSGEV